MRLWGLDNMDTEELIDLAYNTDVKIKLNIPDYMDRDDLIMIGGAITTQELFDNLITGICHLFEDGRILRYGCEIGTINDIQLLDVIDNVQKPLLLT